MQRFASRAARIFVELVVKRTFKERLLMVSFLLAEATQREILNPVPLIVTPQSERELVMQRPRLTDIRLVDRKARPVDNLLVDKRAMADEDLMRSRVPAYATVASVKPPHANDKADVAKTVANAMMVELADVANAIMVEDIEDVEKTNASDKADVAETIVLKLHGLPPLRPVIMNWLPPGSPHAVHATQMADESFTPDAAAKVAETLIELRHHADAKTAKETTPENPPESTDHFQHNVNVQVAPMQMSRHLLQLEDVNVYVQMAPMHLQDVNLQVYPMHLQEVGSCWPIC